MGNVNLTIKPINEGGVKTWIGVQHQLGAFFPIFLFHTEEIILIIDEEFSDAIKVYNKYNVPIFRKTIVFLNNILKELGEEKISTNYYMFIEEFIKIFEEFINSLFKYIERRDPEDWELDYTIFIKLIDDIIITKGSNDYITTLSETAFNYIRNKRMSPFKFIFNKIYNFIENYKDLKRNAPKEIEKWIKSVFYIKEGKYTFLYYDRQLLKGLLGKNKILKLIINDATADKFDIEYLIDDIEPIEDHYEDWDYENYECHQLKKKIHGNRLGKEFAHFGISSFHQYESSVTTFNYIINNFKLILELHKDEPVFVVAREISAERLKDINGGIKLSDYVHTLGHNNIHFIEYPVKGTNEFSNINVVVILMNPDLPGISIKRQSILFNKNPIEYRQDYSKKNIIQAVGRILRGDEYKYIYMFPGIDIPEIKKGKKYCTYKNTSTGSSHKSSNISYKNT